MYLYIFAVVVYIFCHKRRACRVIFYVNYNAATQSTICVRLSICMQALLFITHYIAAAAVESLLNNKLHMNGNLT